MTKRWKQRPTGSTWGDWGDDDELGRINLVTSEKVLAGVREVEAGITLLPQPAARLSRAAPRSTSAAIRPSSRPTEDMDGEPATFYNVHMSEMEELRRSEVRRRLGGRRGDAVAAVLDAVGLARPRRAPSSTPTATGSKRPSTTTAIAPASTSSGPVADARGDGGAHRAFAHHLGLEHMAFHGVQGRGVLVDLAHHLGDDWQGVDRTKLEEIMAADGVVVEPGDMLLLHTGFATKVLEWERNPDPVKIHTMCSYLDARDPSLLEWIADSQISALVADNYAVEGLLGKDRDPSRHSFLPIHHLCLFKLGVPLGEMWYLHELAGWLREHGRSRFLLTAPPLRMPGIVGSPVTPIATV